MRTQPRRAGGERERLEHPAARAWRELGGDAVEPERVALLKRKAKGAVYRLAQAGPGRCDVIAKRASRAKAEIERLVYEEVYPKLPLPTLDFHGLVEEEGGAFCWLFLEDIGECSYGPSRAEHRTLAARWFGTMNPLAAEMGVELRLPRRGPEEYRAYLRSILEELPGVAASRVPDPDQRRVLDRIVSHCAFLEERWPKLEAFCDGIPRTLVHGDCLAKNVHLRTREGGTSLVPFDWGGAGWGLAATDLGQLALPYHEPPRSEPDVATYVSVARRRWPRLDGETVQQASNLGQLFWSLKVIRREIPAFDYEWAALEDTLVNFRIYALALADATRMASFLR